MNKDIKKIIQKNKYRSNFYKKNKSKKPKVEKPKQFNHKKIDGRNYVKLLYAFKNRVLISVLILMVLLISKKSDKINFIYEETIKHLNFAQIDKFVSKNIGAIFPKLKGDNISVNNSYITLNNSSKYENGLMVTTSPFEVVQSHTKGIVIKKYSDKIYGETIVIQDEYGREFTYGFLEDIKVNLYSRVSYGEKLGIAQISEKMTEGNYYLSIKADNNYLDVIAVVNDEI